MAKQPPRWKRGPGTLGLLRPLLGTWVAKADSPMGPLTCTRTFRSVLGGKYVELDAAWKFRDNTYEERAIYGADGRSITFWSFTSDGKRSTGELADGKDVHPEAICFVANFGDRTARMIYWPGDDGDIRWAVEAKTVKGWKRFTDHHYQAKR